MITIQRLNKVDLQAFVESAAFSQLPFLPISRHRAISHIHNPRAGAGDTLLLLAYDEDQLVGYLGVLPDWIFDDHGNKHTCGWLSCMWIDISQRGKGISKKLVREALDAYDSKILVTEFTYPAQRLYDKLGAFKNLQKIDGLRLYIRSDFAKLIPPKGPRFARLTGLWKRLDKLANLVMDQRFLFGRRTAGSTINYHEEINQEIMQFMATAKTAELFRRGQSELNWMLSHPWIKEQSTSDVESEKYHFSSIAKRFQFVPVTLSDDGGKTLAFLMFAIRDHHLKIPYCYFEESAGKEVKTCIEHHLIKWKISTCTFFHPSLVRLFTNDHYPALYTRKMQRHYIISKVFTQFDADQIYTIQDGDADCAFT